MFRVGDAVLGLYEVRDVIRSGGMGLVYRVHHRGWGVDLAVKTPRPEFVGGELFRAEAESWVSLGAHPNVVSCAYVRQLEGRPAAFAEWVDGGSLADAVRERRVAALPDVLDAAIQFAWGLDHAHRHGMVHQDVKPANAMREPDGTVKVTDFGLAKAVVAAGAPRPDVAGVTYGGLTPAYCSPEQLRAAGGAPVRLTPATDVWSWALSVLEMLNGGPATRAGHLAGDVFEALLGNQLRPPAALVAVLRECFRPDPAARPADLGEVAGRLAAVYAEATGRAYPRRPPSAVRLRADGLSNQALSMLDLGHPDRAEELWEQALRADPQHRHTVYNRGLFGWRRGRITDGDLIAQLGPVRADDLIAQVERERGPAPAVARLAGGHPVAAVAATPDGRLVAVGEEVHGNDAPLAAVRLWDLAAKAARPPWPAHARRVGALAVDPAGRFVVSGGDDGTVIVWDAATGEPRHRLEAGAALQGLALSEDGSALAALTRVSGVLAWDVATGALRHTLQRPNAGYEGGAVTLGRGHVVAWSNRTHRIRVWAMDSGELVRSAPVDASTVLLGRGAAVALLARADDVELIDPVTGARLERWAQRPAWGREAAALSDDGRLLLAAAGERLQVWDVATGRCRRTLEGHEAAVRALDIPGPGLAASGSSDRTARLWWPPAPGAPALWSYAKPRAAVELTRDVDVVRGAVELVPALLHGGQIAAAADALRTARATPGFERDRTLLSMWATAGRHGRRSGLLGAWPAARLPAGSVLTPDGTLALRHRPGFRTVEGFAVADGTPRYTLFGHGDAVTVLRITPDGRLAVTASDDRTVRVWDLATGQCRHALTGHKDKVSALAVSADGRIAVSGDRGGTVAGWDLQRGRRRRIATPHGGWVGSLALNDDGSVALVFHRDGEVCVLDTATGRCLHNLPGLGARARAVAISADGHTVLCPSHTGAGLWVTDLRTRELRHMLLGHDGPVRAVALTPDGRRACSASADGTLRVWNVAAGACTAVLTGHEGAVEAVDLAPGGAFAVSTGADATIRVWDLDAGRALRALPAAGPGDRVGLAAGAGLAWASARDAETAVWELDWDYDLSPP